MCAGVALLLGGDRDRGRDRVRRRGLHRPAAAGDGAAPAAELLPAGRRRRRSPRCSAVAAAASSARTSTRRWSSPRTSSCCSPASASWARSRTRCPASTSPRGARLTEALLATAGIIAGVSGGLALADVVGVEHRPARPRRRRLGERHDDGASAAAICAGGVRVRVVRPAADASLPIALIAGGRDGDLAVDRAARASAAPGRPRWRRSSSVWSATPSPAGCGCRRWSSSVSAVVPMLPGLSIYRGLSLLGRGRRGRPRRASLAMVTAASVAIALASGVILGEYVAQPLKREARRLESRLAGPRLVGPLRARTGRHGRAASAGRGSRDARAAEGQPDRPEQLGQPAPRALPSYGARPAARRPRHPVAGRRSRAATTSSG